MPITEPPPPKMRACGKPEGALARVVDVQGRVHGVSGLRVADASIMPTIVAGNTNIATIMIAEKIADAIATAPER